MHDIHFYPTHTNSHEHTRPHSHVHAYTDAHSINQSLKDKIITEVYGKNFAFDHHIFMLKNYTFQFKEQHNVHEHIYFIYLCRYSLLFGN